MATEEDAKLTVQAPHVEKDEITNAAAQDVESKPHVDHVNKEDKNITVNETKATHTQPCENHVEAGAGESDDHDQSENHVEAGAGESDDHDQSENHVEAGAGESDDHDRSENHVEAGAGESDDLRELERKALAELRSRLEEAIKANKLFKEEQYKKEDDVKDKESSESSAADHDHPAAAGEMRLWGVPLLPSKGDKGTNVVLLKFLKARELEVRDALDMLRDTLRWRKDNNIDGVLDEDFGNDFTAAGFMDGKDREGHPVCYNVLGVLAGDEMYNKTLAAEEMRQRFLRWRVQLMEKGIRQLELLPGRPSTLVQVNDLKHTPGPNRNGVRLATKQAVALLQDNYPEFAAKNIFINVPFWYYAFGSIFSPFTQRTKSKFVYARASRVTETLLKYISVEQIPVQYGGLKQENDSDFSIQDEATEVTIKSGSTESIDISAPQVGTRLIWDLTVVGWDVSYKEEFVPEDESSYPVIVQRERKMVMQDEAQVVRNSFTNKEPGKLMLVVQNSSFKKKRILYRYKIRTPPA